MAIKQAQYSITLANGEDVYHFQTDDKMVKIIDKNNNVLGTLKEFGFEGKVVTSGSFKNLKVSGLYKVSGLTGLPAGYDVGKISILSVKAIGTAGAPELINYDLISQDGDIYHNTIVGTKESGWSEGGTSLKNRLTSIVNNIGTLASLKTKNKTSLVGAVNELKDSSDLTTTKLNTLTTDFNGFKSHNHDARYPLKSGDTLSGHMRFTNNNALRGTKTTGEAVNLLNLDNSNRMKLGETGISLDILGSGLTFNGKKVWHEENDGSGSGLDADKLAGKGSDLYAALDVENRFKDNLVVEKNLYAGQDLYFGDSYANRKNQITSTIDGTLKIGKSSPIEIDSAGKMRSFQDIVLDGRQRWVGLRFTLTGTKGLGFERDNNNGRLVLHDWDEGKTGFSFNGKTGTMSIPNAIELQGRKLFLQGGTPTGSIPTGSVWIA